MLAVGSRIMIFSSFGTVNSANMEKKLVGVFARLAIVGSDVVATV
jgi:hypothetical protein